MTMAEAESARRDELSSVARKGRMAGLVRQARRAGRVVVGVKLSRDAAREGRLAAALVAEDLAPARRDALTAAWRGAGVAVFRGWTKDELGELAGRPAVAVLGMTDRNIAAGLKSIDAAPRDDAREHRAREPK